MTGLVCAIILIAVLWWTIKSTRRQFVNDRQPDPVDRLAQWERRRGEYLAEQRRRQHRATIAFDQRATVQPKITPRLPK